MNTALSPIVFDETAASALRKHIETMDITDSVPVVLFVQRLPGAQIEALLDECWGRIRLEADAIQSTIAEFDVFMDKARGQIHMRADRDLATALLQLDEFFSRVALDTERHR